MKNARKAAMFCSLTLAGLAAAAISGWSQQVLSPPVMAACKFADGKTITVSYSSPRMRGRKIFGDLVPFGEAERVNDFETHDGGI